MINAGWQYWVACTIVIAMTSDLVANIWLVYLFHKQGSREALHLKVIFATLAVRASLLLFTLFSIPANVQLSRIPLARWAWILAVLATVASIWRFILYLRGQLR